MIKETLAFLPLAVLLFLLTSSQGAFAQGDPLTCFFYPDDPKCADWDNDGFKNDSDPNTRDPCIPDRLVDACDDWDNDGAENTLDDAKLDPCKPNPTADACITTATDITSLIQNEYKHLYISPPSRIYPPGTVVLVDDEKTGLIGTSLIVICRKEQVLGSEFELISSPTSSALRKRNTAFEVSAGFKAEVANLIELKLGGKFKNLNNITLSLQDAKILTLADADLYARVSDNLTKDCKTAIEARIMKGQRPTIVRSVIQATVAYNLDLELNTDVEAEVSAELMKEIVDIAVDAKYGQGEQSSISQKGDGIYWGALNDSKLFEIIKVEGKLLSSDSSPLEAISLEPKERVRVIIGGRVITTDIPAQ